MILYMILSGIFISTSLTLFYNTFLKKYLDDDYQEVNKK